MLKSYLAVALALWPCGAWAQDDAREACEGRPIVTFDHRAKPEILTSSLELSDKETFLIRVINTSPRIFTYTVTGAIAVPRQAAPRSATEVTIYEECVTHSKQYGGYLMRVERNEGEETELSNKVFIVSVVTEDWNYEISGGFSLAGLRDRIYALNPAGDDGFRVVEDRGEDKRSDARPGVVSIITVFHSSRPRFGMSFGFVINEGAGATYYLGPTWRIGNVAGITGGVALGPVTRLPDGVNVNDIVADVNLLKTRHTRIAQAAFVCLSYSFLGSLDTFKKPFAGQ